MPYQATPPMIDYAQLQQDKARAFQTYATRQSCEQLPAYSDALRDGAIAPHSLDEKKRTEDRSRTKTTSSTLKSALKGIVAGGVHKHHPYVRRAEGYDTPESRYSSYEKQRAEDQSSTKTTSSALKSALKGIVAGDVHKHHPYVRRAESYDTPESRYSSYENRRPEDQSTTKSTSPTLKLVLKGIIAGDVHKHHPYVRRAGSYDTPESRYSSWASQ